MTAQNTAQRVTSPFSGNDLKGYSLSRAIMAASRREFRAMGSLELEAHRALVSARAPADRNRVEVDLDRILIPNEVIRDALQFGQRAQYLVGTAAQGGNLVQTYFGAGIVQLLRNRSAVVDMGAMVIDGLVGNVAIPRWAGTITAQWLAEAGAVADSEGTVQQISSTPKMLAARSTLSRQLMLQSTPGIDALIGTDLMRGLGVALDLAALNGTGASNQPLGVLAAAIGTTAGATLTYANLIANQVAVLAANGCTNPETTGYIMPAAIAGLLAQRAQGTLNWPLWDSQTNLRDGTVNGWRAIASEQVPAQVAVFGDWSNLMILEWGPGLEIAVNPVQTFASGDIGIRGFLAADIVVRHLESFNKITAIT